MTSTKSGCTIISDRVKSGLFGRENMAERVKRLEPVSTLLYPLVDRRTEAVVNRRKVVSVSGVTIHDYLPPEEKIELAERLRLQMRGHNRRPTKKPQRKSAEGAALSKAKRVREGLEPVAMAEQVDLLLEGNTPDNSLTLNPNNSQNKPATAVFIAASDLYGIRQILGNIRQIELDSAEDDPEVLEVLNEDQNNYGQLASTPEKDDSLQPRVRGQAIHWVNSTDISELI